jgi:hypothetical protein
VRVYGPLLLHVYGVTESTVRDEWTLAQFRAYRDFALDLMKNTRRGGL